MTQQMQVSAWQENMPIILHLHQPHPAQAVSMWVALDYPSWTGSHILAENILRVPPPSCKPHGKGNKLLPGAGQVTWGDDDFLDLMVHLGDLVLGVGETEELIGQKALIQGIFQQKVIRLWAPFMPGMYGLGLTLSHWQIVIMEMMK